MKALVKEVDFFGVKEIQKPEINSADDVIIKVEMAGLCRTDVFVAEGTIKGKDKLVLGHEFSGIVDETGVDIKNLKKGDHVTVMPVIPCGKCNECRTDKTACQNVTMLGIDHDGCFAEYIKVPSSAVYKIPADMDFKKGAYTEPLAASLAVLKAVLPKNGKGLIYGNNRISELTRRVMVAYGYTDVEVYDEKKAEVLTPNTYDFITETIANTASMEQIIDAVKPRGTIIIKSRKYELVGMNFAKLVRKEICFRAVNYGDFEETIELMGSKNLQVDDLLGEAYDFNSFKNVFSNARNSESKKIFLSPTLKI